MHLKQDQIIEKDEVPSCSKNKNGRLSTIFIMDKKFYHEDTGFGLYGENSENTIPGICFDLFAPKTIELSVLRF